jgi:hypothetical protein
MVRSVSGIAVIWAALAIAFAPSGPSFATWGSAGTLVVGSLLATAARPTLLPWAARAVGAFPFVATLAVALWFWRVPAPASADWRPECGGTARVTIDRDRATVRDVRAFRYRSSDTDFEPRWETRSYDLATLDQVDVFFSHWGPKFICHTFLSFGFALPDGRREHVCVSIEARKRSGQEYSALGGMFRQFTLQYVWADETDVVRVRTDFRGETVRRYRLRLDPPEVRRLFERYAHETERLAAEPRWYNAVTQSCGVDMLRTALGGRMGLIPSPRDLLNGLWEADACLEGRTEPRMTLDDTLEAADITADAQAAGAAESEAFGAAIRARDVSLGAPRIVDGLRSSGS